MSLKLEGNQRIPAANHSAAPKSNHQALKAAGIAIGVIAVLGLLFAAYCAVAHFSGIKGLPLANVVGTPAAFYGAIAFTVISSVAAGILLGQASRRSTEQVPEQVRDEADQVFAPDTWEELPGDGQAYELLRGTRQEGIYDGMYKGGLWPNNLNSIGPPVNPRDTGDLVFGTTCLAPDFPGNKIKLSGGTANAVSAPQDEGGAAQLLRLVAAKDFRFVTRLALPWEAPNETSYFDYVPKEIGGVIELEGMEVTLTERVYIPLDGNDPTQYATRDLLEIFEDGKKSFVPVYTYYNFADRAEPDPTSFSNFIRLTSQEKGREFVHCKSGVGRTGTYLLCKYSDTNGERPRLMEDFRAMRAARSREMVQGDNQFAFACGFIRTRRLGGEMSLEDQETRRAASMSGRVPLEKKRENFYLLCPLTPEQFNEIFDGVKEETLKSFLGATTNALIQNTRLLRDKNMTYPGFVELVDSRQEELAAWGLRDVSPMNLFRDHAEAVAALVGR